MGIPLHLAYLMGRIACDIPDKPNKRVLTIGKQTCSFTYEEVTRVLGAKGIAFQEVPPDQIILDPACDGVHPRKEFLDQRTFFRLLGFDEKNVHALDIDDYEGADILHDLNTPIPAELAGTQDLVYDGGVVECAFSPKDVLLNLRALVRVGGIIVNDARIECLVPVYYRIDASLFGEFYRANGFQEIYNKYLGVPANPAKRYFIEFDPDDRKFPLAPYFSVHCVCAHRKSHDTPFQAPLPARYREAWQKRTSLSKPKRLPWWKRLAKRVIYSHWAISYLVLAFLQLRKGKRISLR